MPLFAYQGKVVDVSSHQMLNCSLPNLAASTAHWMKDPLLRTNDHTVLYNLHNYIIFRQEGSMDGASLPYYNNRNRW